MKKILAIIFILLIASNVYAAQFNSYSNDTSVSDADELIFWNTSAGAVRNILWSSFKGLFGWTDGGTSLYLTTSTDNVGVGTSNPLVKLDVLGDTYNQNSTTKINIPSASTGTDIKIGGYFSIATTSANWGGGGTTEKHFLSGFNPSRIRQACTLKKVQFYLASKPAAVTNFYIEIWRYDQSSAKYDRISQEDIWSLTTAAQTNLITLATPVNVKEGDYIGYGVVSSSDPGSFLTKADSGTNSFTRQTNATMYTTSATTADDFNWESKTLSTDYLPIISYTDTAPLAVFLGDSAVDGFGVTPSWLKSNGPDGVYAPKNPNNVENIPQRVAHALNLTYQNMAWAGKTTAQVAARITTDLVDLKPKVMFFFASGNDAVSAEDDATFTTNVDTILDACVNNGCKPVVVRYMSVNATLLSNAQMQIQDAYDTILVTEATERNAIIIDPKNIYGQFRSGGTAGNLWDIKDEFTFDRIHPNNNGMRAMSEAIIQGVSSVTIRGGVNTGNLWVNQDVTFTPTADYKTPGLRNIWALRTSGYEQQGVGIRLKAGFPPSQSTDEDGGDLYLSSGGATGTGKSTVYFQTAYPKLTGILDNDVDTKMIIDGYGNVAIGTTTPSARLDIRSARISPVIYLTGHNLNDLSVGGTFTSPVAVWYKLMIDATGTPDTFKWSNDGGSTWVATGVSMTGSAQTLNNGTTITWAATTGHTLSDEFDFYVDNSNPLIVKDGSGSSALSVLQSGNVGIGTTTASSKLTVTGAIAATGAITGSNLSGTNTGDQTNISGNAATVTTNANLTGPITSVGNATSVASQTGTGSVFVMQGSPTLTTPNIGTPSAGVATNLTGIASGLTAGTVTTNANLTGDVTSVGNATTIATVNKPWQDGGANVYQTVTTDVVGIGTTTPSATTTLEIVKQSSNSPLKISSSPTNTGDILNITSSGLVGIGTTLNASGTMLAIMGGNVGIGTWIPTARLQVGSSAGSFVKLDSSGNVTATGTTSSTTGFVGTPITGGSAASSSLTLRSTSGTGTTDSIVFQTGSQVEAMRINTSQNVGIGTTTAGSKLGVSGGVAIGSTYVPNSAPTNGLMVEGNVGIGTIIAGSALVVKGDVGINGVPTGNLHIKMNNDAKDGLLITGSSLSQTANYINALEPGTLSSIFSVSSLGNLVLNFAGFSAGGNITAYSKSSTDTVSDIYTAILDRGAGNGGVGFGLGYLFRLEDGSGARADVGRFKYAWKTPTAGSETATFTIQNKNNGILVDSLVLDGDKVGMGTFIPASRLSIMGNVGIGTIGSSYVTTAAPVNGMMIQGNVGIGTVSPMNKLQVNGTFQVDQTNNIGWSIVAGANTACNTTCTSACVMGFASAVTGSDPVACTDATADTCLCAGPN